jgi:hypothetical protein
MVLKQSSIANRENFLINCHACGRICRIIPAEVGHSDRIVKTFGMDGFYIYQCDCGNRFNVKLDFRRKPRFSCQISSFYTTIKRTSSGRSQSPAEPNPYQSTINSVIKDISVEGIGLLTHRRHDLKPDDELLVTFVLRRGDKRDRMIERRGIVRTVRGNNIGVEFFPADKRKPEIGFYLMEEE